MSTCTLAEMCTSVVRWRKHAFGCVPKTGVNYKGAMITTTAAARVQEGEEKCGKSERGKEEDGGEGERTEVEGEEEERRGMQRWVESWRRRRIYGRRRSH